MIPVTKTFLPPLEEYTAILKRAWDKSWLTNRGDLSLELETKLKQYLGISNITLTTNGTLPIQIAIKALNLTGEIITTPFSYVATTASIVWENCKPVFVDIHPDYLTVDETLIESAITPATSAILVTHVFGNPCHVEAIESIAKKHNLKVIYDAAHAFGVSYQGKSVLDFGNVSTCSFHATKLFHCGEGGAFICKDAELHAKLFYHHNFGHKNNLEFYGLGINAKISELQAAMGLAVFNHFDFILAERKKVVDYYEQNLQLPALKKLKIRTGTEWNYSYYPVIFESEAQLLKVEAILIENKIVPRRYFNPSLNTVSFSLGKQMPISESIASRVMCLPLYVGLAEADLEKICILIKTTI
ncbi:MAG: DegT/DnrJ/EryC1/StrS family aminotransferase [Bacteroidetes bacterium]|nr:DegT/DnrJ/EryC1/StrS family aminotransferase [Bacteroidota bacterium]